MSDVISIIYTTLSDFNEAKILAQKAVELKLAVCVNILPACLSIYEWADGVKMQEEFALIFKTSVIMEKKLEEFIIASHSYDLPAIIKLHPNTNDEFSKYISETLKIT